MKIAFIIQRYGTEILGGSEYHCRLIAERMAVRHQVEVLTTCAREYTTWKNEYPEGVDRIRGVNVRRFPTAQTRDLESFNRYSDWIFSYPHSRDDELRWLQEQGPWCPALLDHLERQHQQYDVLIFFTYLYAPTVLGLSIAPGKSILVPTAHDEPAIHLGIYRELFATASAVAFNTDSERAFLMRTFDLHPDGDETVGCGVDLLDTEGRGKPRRGVDAPLEGPLVPDDVPAPQPESSGGPGGRRGGRPHTPPDAAADPRRTIGQVFRRRHRLFGPLALYGGRIDPGKGCEELFEYFGTYVDQGGEATLALMGAKLMPIPEAPWVRFAGLLSETERLQALAAADVVVVPSPLESLSLLALESMAMGTPVLCNARAEVLVEHCRRSNAGLYYADRDEFVESVRLLMADARLRRTLGRNGREYVTQHYRWDVILQKYDRLIATRSR
ncbi:MAG: glycosyltransferase [Acidobacteria bacterium]|nr:glycosyltransferase [Acidobacteriota bacterium]